MEAAIYIPLLLLLYLFVMQSGIDLYTEMEENAAAVAEEGQVDVLELFYKEESLGDLLRHGD